MPYKGSGPAVSDLLGGQVNPYMFDSITSARPYIDRASCAPGPDDAKRSNRCQRAPLAEAGLPGYGSRPGSPLFMPAAAPKGHRG